MIPVRRPIWTKQWYISGRYFNLNSIDITIDYRYSCHIMHTANSGIHSILFQCRASVEYGGPTLGEYPSLGEYPVFAEVLRDT